MQHNLSWTTTWYIQDDFIKGIIRKRPFSSAFLSFLRWITRLRRFPKIIQSTTLNVQFKIRAQLKCTTNEKRNLSEHELQHDKQKFQIENFLMIYGKYSLDSIFSSIYRVKTALKWHQNYQSR